MKDSPLVSTSISTSFEATSATGDAVNLDNTDVTFSATTPATAVTPLTTDAETQTDPVTRYFANAAVVMDDIIAPMNIDHDYSYVNLPTDSVRKKIFLRMMHTI